MYCKNLLISITFTLRFYRYNIDTSEYQFLILLPVTASDSNIFIDCLHRNLKWITTIDEIKLRLLKNITIDEFHIQMFR